MSDLKQKLDEIYDKMVNDCPDPRAKQYQAEFKAAEAEARERFERWQRETLDDRRRYHGLCGLDKKEADELAHQDVLLLAFGARAERNLQSRVALLDYRERLARLLEELNGVD